MNKHEPGGHRAASVTSYLLVSMIISGVSMAMLAGSIALKDNGTAFFRWLSSMRPCHLEAQYQPNEKVNSPPHIPPVVSTPKTERQLLREAVEQVGQIDRILYTVQSDLRRIGDLTPDTLDMVRHYADNHAVKNDHDLVFPCRNGSWQSIRNWRRRGFGQACEEAGLMVTVDEDGKSIERPKYKLYDLRHFYASMLIDQRINLKRIQILMGHRNIQTRLNVYGHLIERVEATTQERTSVLTCLRRTSCGQSVA